MFIVGCGYSYDFDRATQVYDVIIRTTLIGLRRPSEVVRYLDRAAKVGCA